ncbi:MAG: hypothetical protein S4CHLAM37_16990 [Chlamydiia bacterium]|nr:hypothetical protein [Chlamydiia bacterium]
MAALMKGDITKEQFCSTMIFKAACKEEQNITSIQLFARNGRINKKAFALIKATVNSIASKEVAEQYPPEGALPQALQNMIELQSGIATIPDEKITAFFDMMREKPESEQTLYLMPDASSWEKTYDYFETPDFDLSSISKAVKLEGAFNLLGTDFNSSQTLIPTFSMMQALIDATCGDNACEISPAIGTTTADDIKYDLPHSRRDMGIPYQDFLLPTKADGLKATSFEFIFHDFYHLYTLSTIPRSHREALFETVIAVEKAGRKILNKLRSEDQPVESVALFEKGLSWFRETLIDAEFMGFRLKEKMDLHKFLWSFFSSSVASTVTIRPAKERESCPLLSERICVSFINNDLYVLTGKELAKNLSRFEKKDTTMKQSLSEHVGEIKNTIPAYLMDQILPTVPIYLLKQGVDQALSQGDEA